MDRVHVLRVGMVPAVPGGQISRFLALVGQLDTTTFHFNSTRLITEKGTIDIYRK